jgi:hypothetical protein
MEGISAAGGSGKSAVARGGDEPGMVTHTGGTEPMATRAGVAEGASVIAVAMPSLPGESATEPLGCLTAQIDREL